MSNLYKEIDTDITPNKFGKINCNNNETLHLTCVEGRVLILIIKLNKLINTQNTKICENKKIEQINLINNNEININNTIDFVNKISLLFTFLNSDIISQYKIYIDKNTKNVEYKNKINESLKKNLCIEKIDILLNLIKTLSLYEKKFKELNHYLIQINDKLNKIINKEQNPEEKLIELETNLKEKENELAVYNSTLSGVSDWKLVNDGEYKFYRDFVKQKEEEIKLIKQQIQAHKTANPIKVSDVNISINNICINNNKKCKDNIITNRQNRKIKNTCESVYNYLSKNTDILLLSYVNATNKQIIN